MNTSQKLDYKQRILQFSIEILKERIAACQQMIANAQASANDEEKSSAGDKYETSRAMSHLEKDMFSKQLVANKNEMAALLSIDCSKVYTSVVPGSVIRCSEYTFFIAAGLGKIFFEDEDVYLLSPNAPLANTLYNKSKGDSLQFNNKELLLTDVF